MTNKLMTETERIELARAALYSRGICYGLFRLRAYSGGWFKIDWPRCYVSEGTVQLIIMIVRADVERDFCRCTVAELVKEAR